MSGKEITGVVCMECAEGLEREEDYYEASKKRLEEFMAQGRLFE